MKKGFTLLELIIVIIIIGVLATLGFAQYTRMVEKSRGAEAKTVIGAIRSMAAARRLERGTLVGYAAAEAGIGANQDQIPGPAAGNCRGTNFFWYNITAVAADSITVRGTRCTANGKLPQGATAGWVQLATNFANGTDTWTSSGY